MDIDKKIFKSKSLADLSSEVYDKASKREKELAALITQLKGMITNIGDATVIVPLLSSYMGQSIKNDENLIKLIAVLQKALADGKTDENGSLKFTEKDKEMFLNEIQDFGKKQ